MKNIDNTDDSIGISKSVSSQEADGIVKQDDENYSNNHEKGKSKSETSEIDSSDAYRGSAGIPGRVKALGISEEIKVAKTANLVGRTIANAEELVESEYTAKEQAVIDKGEPLYSKYSQSHNGKAPSGVSNKIVQDAIDEFKQAHNGFPFGIQFEIHQTKDDAFGKAAVAYLKEHGTNTVKGEYYGNSGVVKLVASDFHNIEDVRAAIRHEILAHHGLNLFIKADKRAFIDRIKASRNERSLKKLWAEIDVDYADQTEAIKAEEVLARIAEPGSHRMSKMWNDLVQMIRNYLISEGWITDKVTKGELKAYLEDVSDSIARGAEQQFFPKNDGSQFSRESEASESYSNFVDNVLDEKINKQKFVSMGKGYDVLKAVGIPDLPLVTSGNVIDKIHYDHGLTRSQIKSLPDMLPPPVLVFDSESTPGTYLVIVEETIGGKPLAIALHPNETLGRIEINKMASAHPRQKETKIVDWMNNGYLRYIDKQKSPDWQMTVRLQLPYVSATNQDSTQRVLTGRGTVKKTPLLIKLKSGQQWTVTSSYLLNMTKIIIQFCQMLGARCTFA